MKKIILVRHAKSDSKHPYPSDFERPLNDRGKMDAPAMAKLLNEIHPDIQLFISSPATRAKHTAEYFAEQFGIEKKQIQFDQNLYCATSAEILKSISLVDDSLNSIAVFGHNPGITDLANHLGKKYIPDMPTSSFAIIKINSSSWDKIEFAPGLLEHFDFPKSRK